MALTTIKKVFSGFFIKKEKYAASHLVRRILLALCLLLFFIPGARAQGTPIIAGPYFSEISPTAAYLAGEAKQNGYVYYMILEARANNPPISFLNQNKGIITGEDTSRDQEAGYNPVIYRGGFPVAENRRFNRNLGQGRLVPDKDYRLYYLTVDSQDNISTVAQLPFTTRAFPALERLEPGEHQRGIRTDRSGVVSIEFKERIELIEENYRDISLVDRGGHDYVTDISVSQRRLEIDYDNLLPFEQYTVIIPRGSIQGVYNVPEIGTGTVSAPGGSNLLMEGWTFYSERTPQVISAYFSPVKDGQVPFFPGSSPFSMTNPDPLYRIPDLINVNKLGVGVNQSLVVEFQDKLGELEIKKIEENIRISGTPAHRDLKLDVALGPGEAELIISFRTDDPEKMLNHDTVYTLTIGEGAVQDIYGGGPESYNKEIVIRFKTADGFKRAILDSTAQELNAGIFRDYRAENIALAVPEIYITRLETIHQKQGLDNGEGGAPNLTNIKIEAHPQVKAIRLETNRGVRPNLTRGENGSFSTVFAGLEANISQIQIMAYDRHGKLLEKRAFRLRGGPGNEVVNQYIPAATNVFGKTYSLYEFMQSPGILRDVLEQVPVSELNRIRLFYPFFSPYDDVPF